MPYLSRPVPDDVDPDALITEDQSSLKAELLEAPEEVELGKTIRYAVRLKNAGDDEVPLDPCPAFYQAWGESGTAVSDTSFFNCDEAPDVIAPGESVTFEMELLIKDVEADFEGTIVWYLGHPDSRHRGELVTSGPVTTRLPTD